MKTQKLLFSSILATGLAFNASCSDFDTSFPQIYDTIYSTHDSLSMPTTMYSADDIQLMLDLADPSKEIFRMGNKSSLISTPRALCAGTLFLGIPIACFLVSEKLEKKNKGLKDNKIYKSAKFSLLSLTYSLPYIIGHSEKRPFLFAAKCALISNLIFFTQDKIISLLET